MAVPTPVAKEHEIEKLLLATYLITFLSGLIDALGWISTVTHALPTHLSGTTIKIGIYLFQGKFEHYMIPFLGLLLSFFGGCVIVGMIVCRPENKSLKTTSLVLLAISCVLACAAAGMVGESQDAKYLAAAASGMQNTIMTVTTGFARTSHVTGTVTDIGLLVGQGINRDTWKNTGHWFKARILTFLIISFFAGAMCAPLLYESDRLGLEEYSMFVPAAGFLILGVLGLLHCEGEKRRMAQEALVFEQMKEADEDAKKRAIEASSKKASQRQVKVQSVVAFLSASTPNVNSMPDKPGQAIRTAVNVHQAAQIFKRSSASLTKSASTRTHLSKLDLKELCSLVSRNQEVMQRLMEANPKLVKYIELGCMAN